MKKFLLIAIFLIASATASFGQCAQKCVGSSATATVAANATWTYQWTITPALAFTGQGTNSISIANVGATVGNYVIECVITSPSCDTTLLNCIDVIQSTPTLTLPVVCQSNGSEPVSGGSPAGGTYLLNGTPIITLTSAMIGQTITYTATSGGCSGSITGVLVGAPVPNTIIIIN